MIGHAMLAIRFAPRTLSSVWEASKEKNISLKKCFAIKAPLQINLSMPLYKKTPAFYAGVTYSFLFGGRRGIRTHSQDLLIYSTLRYVAPSFNHKYKHKTSKKQIQNNFPDQIKYNYKSHKRQTDVGKLNSFITFWVSH